MRKMRELIWKNIMNDKLLHLKIKIRNMSDESRLIRQQENKLKTIARKHQERGYHEDAAKTRDIVSGLVEHRTNTYSTSCLRTYTRINLLAYAFLRGKTYKSVEPKSKDDVTQYAENIFKVVKNFSRRSESKEFSVETIQKWLSA